MLASIYKDKAYLESLEVGFGVKSGLDAIFHEAIDALVKLGEYPTYIGVHQLLSSDNEDKALWPTQSSLILYPLTASYGLDLRLQSEGVKILGIPL